MVFEYHRKLDFVTLEYSKNDKFLHISEIEVDYNIVCKNVLYGHFHYLFPIKPYFFFFIYFDYFISYCKF